MAVRLDIRPRLTLPPERPAAVRRGWRLPPLAVPAASYWLAMGALTYVFAHLGPHPLEPTEAAATERQREPTELAPPAFERRAVSETVTSPTQPLDEPPSPSPAAPAPPSEPTPVVAEEHEREHEIRDNREPRRRGDSLGPSSEHERDEAEKREPEPRVAMSFPEFTDSSRAPKLERAADGPRIDSLFERADEGPSKDAVPDAPAPPPSNPDAPAVAASCEAAIARNNEQLTIGAARGAPDISREAYAGILQNGRYLGACNIPERTVFEICAAVKDGHAVGITIVSSPASPKLNACVRRAVAQLKFPQNSRLDVTHTRFDAAGH